MQRARVREQAPCGAPRRHVVLEHYGSGNPNPSPNPTPSPSPSPNPNPNLRPNPNPNLSPNPNPNPHQATAASTAAVGAVHAKLCSYNLAGALARGCNPM